MDEKLSEENGQTLPEEMEVTMTTQLECLVVTPDDADTSSNTHTHGEEAEDVQADSTAAAPSSVSVCKTEDSDDDDSEDSDRYFHRHYAAITGSLFLDHS